MKTAIDGPEYMIKKGPRLEGPRSREILLQKASADAGRTVLLYISPSMLAKLRLDEMNHDEEFLLIPEEYVLRSAHSNIGQTAALSSQANLALGDASLTSVGSRIEPELTDIQGKSIFLICVLFHRLSAGLPTAFQVVRIASLGLLVVT